MCCSPAGCRGSRGSDILTELLLTSAVSPGAGMVLPQLRGVQSAGSGVTAGERLSHGSVQTEIPGQRLQVQECSAAAQMLALRSERTPAAGAGLPGGNPLGAEQTCG